MMKPAFYKTQKAATAYAAELAAVFPKRQFVPVCAGFQGFNIAVQDMEGRTLALAGRRKRKPKSFRCTPASIASEHAAEVSAIETAAFDAAQPKQKD